MNREVLILTLSILPALQGCISWYIPWYGLMMREWPYTASSRDVLGCTSPPTSRFPSALEMSLGLRPRDISRASGNLLVVRDVQPNTSLLLAVYGYNICRPPPIKLKFSSQEVLCHIFTVHYHNTNIAQHFIAVQLLWCTNLSHCIWMQRGFLSYKSLRRTSLQLNFAVLFECPHLIFRLHQCRWKVQQLQS